MKKIFILFALLFSFNIFANTIVIKGYVRDASGKAIANHIVKIGTDSTQASACFVKHEKFTNINGFYADTISCNIDIKKILIYTESCSSSISKSLAITNFVTECNFTICSPATPTTTTPILNYVIVKGYVKDSSGKVTANHSVKVGTDSTVGNTCAVWHVKTTNANGFYIDTLFCNTAIKYVTVTTEACGKYVSNKVAVTKGVAESNFIICQPRVAMPQPVPTCTAYFTYLQQFVSVKFNSNTSITVPNDSIISRKWSFGDGDSAYRLVDPIHIYKKTGVCNVCLSIKTAKGCDSKICKTIVLNDSLPNLGGSILEPVKIITLFPNPAHEKLNVVIWNLNTSTPAELSIVDIYGQKKWSNKATLNKGNNNVSVSVSMLLNGPYFFKVSTAFGVVSRMFYKL